MTNKTEEITLFKTMFLETWIQSSKYIGAGLATIGLTGAGIGVGIVFGSFVLALCISPELETFLFKFAILGFALSEAVGLLALMMAFLILYA